MAYRVDQANGDIIISGFEQGIADSPYSGLTDMKSVNIESIPGEASVSFAFSKVSAPSVATISVISAATTGTLTFSGAASGLENRMAVIFTNTNIPGTATGTCYWVDNANVDGNPTTVKLYSVYGASLGTYAVPISGTGTGSMAVLTMSTPTAFTQGNGNFYCIDNHGNCWSNTYPSTKNSYWTHLGNSVPHQGSTAGAGVSNGINGKTSSDVSYGNGLIFYGTPGSGHYNYLFAFSNGSIDFLTIADPYTWTYGWQPSNGTTGNAGAYLTPLTFYNASNYLNGTSIPRQAIVGPDNRLYFLNGYDISKIAQVTAGTFVPTDTSTYTYTTFSILPTNDMAQCISPLNTGYLIGGVNNVVYQWDSTSNLASYYILLSENNIQQIVTVNTNAYIFVGNRGRIWITNGSQAQIWKKLPDHISGLIDPYFTWGAATYNWNQLYFGVQAKNNANSNIAGYGGLWAIDLTTNALREVGQSSYGTYAGYVTALISAATLSSMNPAGLGLYTGWNDANGNGGVDQSIGTTYTGTQATIISDMIPIGTAIQPITPYQVEWKLNAPLNTGEKIELLIGTSPTGVFTSAGSTANAGMSDIYGMPVSNLQWVLVKALMTGTSGTPSYNRLTEIRLKGATKGVKGISSTQ